MSASLVGSEMCIRDRLCTIAVAPLEATEWHGGHWEVAAGGLRNTTVEGCLLYTSDAADDM
eukprot:1740823-Alexandrium_andersonii.AAC.1